MQRIVPNLWFDKEADEAVSYIVRCEVQAEVDRYWVALSAEPEAEQCGWIKDRYGFSWQIVPTALERLLGDSDPAGKARVVKAMLGMKKLSVADHEAAGHSA